TIALLYSAPCQSFADLAISDPAGAAAMVRDYILEGVDPNESLEGITTTGGRLNVNNAVQALMDNCDVLAANDFESNLNEVSIYPNPSQGLLTISNNRGAVLETVSVYSLDGRLLSELETSETSTVNIEHLANGAYVVMISFEGDSNLYNKIVIKK
ncbi:MAG: T9SS type A sorting domain-containing protein, partial [Bacteroidetes bacterium]|nr:T9SS type A sorting domain-containing protein [Bacteroidota bacterium]